MNRSDQCEPRACANSPSGKRRGARWSLHRQGYRWEYSARWLPMDRATHDFQRVLGSTAFYLDIELGAVPLRFQKAALNALAALRGNDVQAQLR